MLKKLFVLLCLFALLSFSSALTFSPMIVNTNNGAALMSCPNALVSNDCIFREWAWFDYKGYLIPACFSQPQPVPLWERLNNGS